MQKNTKNKAFIYLLLLCLLYVGGQQRVWGQDKFRTIYSWGTAIADTTPKRMLKDVGLSQVVEPQLPIIQEQRRYVLIQIGVYILHRPPTIRICYTRKPIYRLCFFATPYLCHRQFSITELFITITVVLGFD